MNWTRIAAIFAFFGVALGAFGAHGLKDILIEHNSLEIWKTASFYHLVHAVAMLMPGMNKMRYSPALFFSIGITIFSGSLYLLSISGFSWLGAITPVGGLAFLIGWFRLAVFTGKKTL